MMLKHGAIPLETFDQMTNKRIYRILEMQAEILEEQNKEMEKQRAEQDKSLKKMM